MGAKVIGIEREPPRLTIFAATAIAGVGAS